MTANWRALRKGFRELLDTAECPLRAGRVNREEGWYLVDARPADVEHGFRLLATTAAVAAGRSGWRGWLDLLVEEGLGTAGAIPRPTAFFGYARDFIGGKDQSVSLTNVLDASARYCRILEGGHLPKPPQAPKLNGADPATARKRLAADRKARVDAYIEEVRRTTGEKVTRAMIYRVADVDKAEFYRWQGAYGHQPTRGAVERIERVLQKKPHLNAKRP